MGYPGDEGGGPPDSRLDARTRGAALWPPAPGDGEREGAASHLRGPAGGSAGSAGEDAAQSGYGGRSGYGGHAGDRGGSSGSHRRPDGTSSYPGTTPASAGAGYPARVPRPAGTGYGPASPAGRWYAPDSPGGAAYTPTSTGGTGYPPSAAEGTVDTAGAASTPTSTRGTGYPPNAPAGTGYTPDAAAGAGYPPNAAGPGSARGTGRRGREPAGHGEPGRGTPQATPATPAATGGPPSRENAWRRPERRPAQDIQGAPGNTAPNGGLQPRGSLWSAGAFRTAGPGGRGPVRGFPPAPGAPDPVYPPGQFAPWNAPALRAVGAAGRPGLAAGSGPGASGPEYPLLAVSDPSADATATQTWAVLDDAQLAGEWTAAAADAPARPGGGENGHPETGEGFQTGPGGFFEPSAGAVAPAGLARSPGPGAPSGYAGQAGYAGHPVSTVHPGDTVPPGDTRYPAEAGYPGEPGLRAERGSSGESGFPGAESPGQTDPALRAPRPGGRLAARQSRQAQSSQNKNRPAAFQETLEPDTGAGGTTGSRSAARGRKPRTPRKPPSRARMWLMPLVMMVVVIVLITVAYLHFAKAQSFTPSAASPTRQNTAGASASPTLGPWKHITTRADDPKALTLTELFPTRFAAGGTVARTIQQSGHKCPGLVVGTKLRAALRKAGCTQVMRASYLAAGQKIMATIGVLNLASVTDAEKAGKATGATAFIKQLAAKRGPTKNLMKGTGLEEAQFKGHYLMLTWAEFTNLKAPGSAARRARLDQFSRQLVASTAGISLTSRMVFGKPQIP